MLFKFLLIMTQSFMDSGGHGNMSTYASSACIVGRCRNILVILDVIMEKACCSGSCGN